MRIGARLCGSCNGASGTSACNSASNGGVTRAGRKWRIPPCTTRWPSAASCRPPSGCRARGITAGNISLGVVGGAEPKSGGAIASPSDHTRIGTPTSRIAANVIKTDENLMIARHARALVGG